MSAWIPVHLSRLTTVHAAMNLTEKLKEWSLPSVKTPRPQTTWLNRKTPFVLLWRVNDNVQAWVPHACVSTAPAKKAYSRHRYLEVAGRYEEIFAPEMMSMEPQYHFTMGGSILDLKGQDQVESFYRMWAETDQSIFFVEQEEVAV